MLNTTVGCVVTSSNSPSDQRGLSFYGNARGKTLLHILLHIDLIALICSRYKFSAIRKLYP